MKLIKFVVVLLIVVVSISCKKDSPTATETGPMVEGTVAYTSGGGTWEIYYPPGFYLKDPQWIRGSGNSKMMFYVHTKIDSTYLTKRVRVEGDLFEHKPKVDSASVDYSSYYYMNVKTISIIN